MDEERFDRLTRSLASGASRRSVLKALLGLGVAALGGGALQEGDTDAARRPSNPTPTPVRCPGQQIASGGQCVCPAGLAKCGPDCCNPSLPSGDPRHSECCDNACCLGSCYGEEFCCPTPRAVCNGRACCEVEQACCTVDDCCTGSCYGNRQFCCPAETGEICGDDCCDNATERCCEGPGGPICIPIDACCLDAECPDVDEECLEGYCNPQSNNCALRTRCTDIPPDLVCPVAVCAFGGECNYGEMCDEDSVCCGGELCCTIYSELACCSRPDGSHACAPECCDDSYCKQYESGRCIRPRCDADGYCHYDKLCADDQFCCEDELCCPLEPGWGCCTRLDGSHACVPECCDASNCKRPPDDCSTPVCRDDGTCEYIGCPEGQVCGDDGVCQCADGSVICNGFCADNECCGDDVSTCDPQQYFPDCVECIDQTCSAENTQFRACSGFPGGWCDDGRCHACIDNDFNPCELGLQCCSGNCSVELGHCIVPV